MRIATERFTVETSKRKQIVDITNAVNRIVEKSNVQNGICLIHAPHATVGVVTNENESGLVNDILNSITALFPQGAGYKHDLIDDNADAHLASTFLGQSKAFPVENRRLVRGTWQNVFLVELDGPRSREIIVLILGE